MDRVHAHKPTASERRRLHRLKRQRTNAVNRCHARIILLSHGGVRNAEIARQLDITPQWVRRIIHRFNADRLLGIEWYPAISGCWNGPRVFLADIVERICETALSPPQQAIGMTQWSLAKLREYLVRTKVIASISLEWLRQLLHRCQIHLKRTKTWKESHDPQFEAKRRRIRALYSRCPAGGRVICVDEFGPLNLQPRGGHCYAQGKQVDRHRATYHRTGGVRHFLAYYDITLNRIYGRFFARKTFREFLSFLRWVRRRYSPSIRLYIVLDNYSPHRKAEVIEWAAANNVTFAFTPTNASWLNRIECHFTALKKFALNNSDYQTHDDLQHSINSYIHWRNRQRAINDVIPTRN